jgi:GNAT superfamily N-acetyltransferase
MTSSVPDLPSRLTIRDLRTTDGAAGLRLSTIANWNQIAVDWDFMLGHGWGRGISCDGSIVGTVVVLKYPPGIGWIGMVLVDPEWRGMGLATRLMHEAIAFCEDSGLIPALDATPDGQHVYKRLGFIDGGELVRMRRIEKRGDKAKSIGRELGMGPGEAGIAWDRESFGHDRSVLLNWLESAYPDLCVGRSGSDGSLEAAAWGRRGRTAVQVGPVLARSPDSARSFLADFFESEETTWVIDVPVRRSKFIGWLHGQGFEVERPFTRMMRGRFGIDFRNHQYAVAGPDLG